jgi:hypothetical protein
MEAKVMLLGAHKGPAAREQHLDIGGPVGMLDTDGSTTAGAEFARYYPKHQNGWVERRRMVRKSHQGFLQRRVWITFWPRVLPCHRESFSCINRFIIP